MNVLSLFDGMSCGQIALERAGIKVNNYFASEIDKHAIKVTMANYPNTIQIGDVTKVKGIDLPKIDLLIGGSPCQGFSNAGNGLNFNHPSSKLFFEYVRLLKEVNPTYFLLENVRMKKEWENTITRFMNVRPIRLNSSLVSAQERKRLYWTNIPVNTIPTNKRIALKDVLMSDFEWKVDIYGNKKKNQFKASALTGSGGNSGGNHSDMDLVKINEATLKGFVEVKKGDSVDLTHYGSRTRMGRLMRVKSNCLTVAPFDFFYNNGNFFRRYNPIECERLQTVPDNYTNHVSDTQRYKMIGNGWTVDIIVHILSHIPKSKQLPHNQ